MTKNIWFGTQAALAAAMMVVGLASVRVNADEAAPSVTAAAPSSSVPVAEKGNHPCRKLQKAAMEACTAAGFEKGKHKLGKGLFKDCIQPIKAGKSVAGVTLDAGLVEACQAKKTSAVANSAMKK